MGCVPGLQAGSPSSLASRAPARRMCPPPQGAQGRAVAWKQTALSAHTQTFVTISRTFFPPSSSFLTGARPCGAGEKLQPVPPAAPITGGLRNPRPQEGERERGGSGREAEESGRPGLAVKNSAGTLPSLTLSPPAPHHRTLPNPRNLP